MKGGGLGILLDGSWQDLLSLFQLGLSCPMTQGPSWHHISSLSSAAASSLWVTLLYFLFQYILGDQSHPKALVSTDLAMKAPNGPSALPHPNGLWRHGLKAKPSPRSALAFGA